MPLTDEANRKPSPRAVEAGHEPDVVSVRGVLWFAFWLFAVAVAIHVGLWGLLRLFQFQVTRRQPEIAPAVRASLQRTPAAPRLETLPLVPRERLRADEDARLTSYGWINRPGGIARIPIDAAMRIVAERGVPGGKPLPPVPQPPGGSSPAPAASQQVTP
jgi:hypothetical protein